MTYIHIIDIRIIWLASAKHSSPTNSRISQGWNSGTKLLYKCYADIARVSENVWNDLLSWVFVRKDDSPTIGSLFSQVEWSADNFKRTKEYGLGVGVKGLWSDRRFWVRSSSQREGFNHTMLDVLGLIQACLGSYLLLAFRSSTFRIVVMWKLHNHWVWRRNTRYRSGGLYLFQSMDILDQDWSDKRTLEFRYSIFLNE